MSLLSCSQSVFLLSQIFVCLAQWAVLAMAAVTLNVNGYMWPEYKHLLKCLADFLDNIKQVHI